MMRVPVRLAPSRIHGMGLFALEPIAAGTLVWDFDPPVDQAIPAASLASLPPSMRRFLAIYGYRSGDRIILCGDEARYFNHSKTPSCCSGRNQETLAKRDIAPGEELTDDYELFDDDYPAYRHLLLEDIAAARAKSEVT
jgi:SET domain-containing protein